MDHLGKDEIEGFLCGLLEGAGRRRVVGHLLSCAFCRQWVAPSAAGFLQKGEPPPSAPSVAEEEYEPALRRATATARRFSTRWKKEQAKLNQALAFLAEEPRGIGYLSHRQVQSVHGWPLCEALLRRSFEARFDDPGKMLDYAQQAAGVAEHIPPERYPHGFVYDLRAETFAALGNSYRVQYRFPQAEEAFSKALSRLDQGSGDPRLRARVLDLEASLRTDQRRLEDALKLLDEVYVLYMEMEDSHLAGRALISKGINTHYQGNSREAVKIIQDGLNLLNPERDPHLPAIGRQALLHALIDSREFRQASQILFTGGLREAFAAEPLNLLKLRGIEGKIHAGRGRLARGAEILSEVRDEFLRLERHYDAALAGLDLATVLLREGKWAELRELAEEMYETFSDLEISREATKALDFLREACVEETVTVPAIEGVQDFLSRLAWRSSLRFEPKSLLA